LQLCLLAEDVYFKVLHLLFLTLSHQLWRRSLIWAVANPVVPRRAGGLCRDHRVDHEAEVEQWTGTGSLFLQFHLRSLFRTTCGVFTNGDVYQS